MKEKTIWSSDVLAAIDEARRREQEQRISDEFYAKLYKLVRV